MSKKDRVLEEILSICQEKGNYVFDNQLVKAVAKKHGFDNPFDATKLDDTSKFPEVMIEQDFFILHLGEGKHQFIKGIKDGFHHFENISEENKVQWKYRKSLLNEFDTSESNILSVGFNQRIIHDFLYEDIVSNPKVYNARRTKSSLRYNINRKEIITTNLQMEIDLTMELDGVVTVFEGKNNFPDNFAIYQLFHPYLYYKKLQADNQIPIKEITCCYLLRKRNNKNSIIRVYNYNFTVDNEMTSINLLKAKEYNLIQR